MAGVISPLILKPFMTDDKSLGLCSEENSTTVIDEECMNMTESNFPHLRPEDTSTNIHVAFIIMGCILILASLVLNSIYHYFRSQLRDLTNSSNKAETKVTKWKRHILAVLLILFYVNYAFVLRVLPKYLFVFSVTVGWGKSSGSNLVSLYHIGMVCGKVFGLFLIQIIPLEVFLFTQLVTYCVVMVILIVFLSSGPIVLWVCFPLLAISMANINPTSIIWTNKYIGMTGYVVSINTSGLKLGEVVAPMLAGYLLEHVSSVSYLYLTLATASMGLLVFVVCQIIVMKCSTNTSKTSVKHSNN